ncbi:MAG TPA: ferritin-like domain-containing protein [Methylomirabilota bacterium]|jgi:1,2-phenylacetyl-CoA epoxidase catalytic subunit|nr:ferritin-like domain-containing protein [Methylomirabilota bacterium]
MLLTRAEMTLYKEEPRFSVEKDREIIIRALSRLFYGEVGAVKIGQWVTKAPDLEGMLEIVKQTRDETRHTAIFRRLLQRYNAEPLQAVLGDMEELHGVISHTWEEMLFESMVVGEGLALVLLYFYHDVIADEPIRHGLRRVIRDEESHVAYGERKIRAYLYEHPELRDRLLAMQAQLIQHYASFIVDQTPADALETLIAETPMTIIQMHMTRLQRLGLV